MSATHVARAKLAGLTAHRGPDHPTVAEARHELQVAKLEDHIRRVVDSAPAPTPEQLDRLAALLKPADLVGGDR